MAKVFVGMSGGVDSSVSAALLKKAGHDVTGVFIKVWQPEGFPCTWKEDRRDAMRVAAVLNIPFVTLDLQKEYKKEVVDYMIEAYKQGLTPNPDIMCNKSIKFGHFLKYAFKEGADYVATGHYAQTSITKKSDSITLAKSVDQDKDQTYFLWTLTSDQLSKVLFPIGHLPKSEVRKLAKKFKLPTFDKKDSQGLCFIGKIDMKDFLKQFVDSKPGKVINTKNEIIGSHEGAFFYTLGQRHGFTITKKLPEESAFYVIAKDINKNTITVSHRDANSKKERLEKNNAGSNAILISDCNLTKDIKVEKTYDARIRYRQTLQKCKIEKVTGNKYKILFQKPQEAVNQGQSIVIYEKKLCIGGGIITQ